MSPSAAKSVNRSPLRERQLQEEEPVEPPFVAQPQPQSAPQIPKLESVFTEQSHSVTDGKPFSSAAVTDSFVSTPQYHIQRDSDNHVASKAQYGQVEPATSQQLYNEDELMLDIPRLPSAHPSQHDDPVHSTDGEYYQHPTEIDSSHIEGESEEDRAKRIQSIYQEYWKDANYYDGSEEWDARSHNRQRSNQIQQPPLPTNSDRRAWRDESQDYYENQDWQQENHAPSRNRYDDRRVPRDALDFDDAHWETPPRPAYHHSRPSTSYSTSSLPSRARTPSKPLEPLKALPSRDKLDDLTSPISFAPPRRFIGAAGRADPTNRPASPVQVLSSSRSNLAELPTPHRLRRSGSFSSIEFAPMRKFAPNEVDAGDTGSIRSLARTEASLRAVSQGAGRVNRLPQDLVPMGRSGAIASLRPQNYGDVRYG
jgi:hypothetical protein